MPLSNSWKKARALTLGFCLLWPQRTLVIVNMPVKIPPRQLPKAIFTRASLELPHRRVNTLYLGFKKKKKDYLQIVLHLRAKITYSFPPR